MGIDEVGVKKATMTYQMKMVEDESLGEVDLMKRCAIANVHRTKLK